MKSSLKKIKDCRVRMTVEVDAERVEDRYQEVLKDFQKAARIAGFREGRAPMDLVEKKYSGEAREELLKSLIPEAYHESVRTQKVSPVSLPSVSDIKFERGKKLTFAAEFEQAPEVPIKNYKGLRLKRESSEISADDVEKGMQSLIESRAELVPLAIARPVQKDDFITVDIELWQNGQYVPAKKGVLLYVEENPEDDFFEKVVGANLDEVREITRGASAEDRERGIVGRTPYTKLWVRGIKEKRLPELNDEFAKEFGKDTVEALREAVRKDLAAHRHRQSVDKMKAELYDKLLTMASFALPETLVEKQKERLIEQAERQSKKMGGPGLTAEQRQGLDAEAAEKARNQIKLYFILQQIAENEDIHEDEIELERQLNAIAEESKRPLDEVRHVFEDDLRESMREAKTVDFLIANAKFEENKKEGSPR